MGKVLLVLGCFRQVNVSSAVGLCCRKNDQQTAKWVREVPELPSPPDTQCLISDSQTGHKELREKWMSMRQGAEEWVCKEACALLRQAPSNANCDVLTAVVSALAPATSATKIPH